MLESAGDVQDREAPSLSQEPRHRSNVYVRINGHPVATENPVGGDRSGRVVILESLWSRAVEFLSVREYRNVNRWADALMEPPAAIRGRMANRVCGEPSSQLHVMVPAISILRHRI